jgi:uncharacterized membrane protein YfcA
MLQALLIGVIIGVRRMGCGSKGQLRVKEAQDMETHIFFFLAAIAAGAINTLAGGGGLLTFPLLTLVVSPVSADATSAFALLPAYPTAVWRSRHELAGVDRRWMWLLLVTGVVGGLAGALVLVWTADRNFEFLVPWLVLGSTALFLLGPTLARRRGDGGASGAHVHAHRLWPLEVSLMLAVAFYGGYFGAGIGILMIAALSLFETEGVHRVVALKNLITGSLRGVAVLALAVEGTIDWGYAVPMALGGLLGGYLGGMVSGRVNPTVLRTVVITIGFGVGAYYLWALYGPAEFRIGSE